MAMKKNRGYKLRAIIGIITITIIICVFVGIYILAHQKTTSTLIDGRYSTADEMDSGYKYIQADGKKYTYNSSLVGLLFIGVDSTESLNSDEVSNSNTGVSGRADSIQLILFDTENKRIKIIAISRDSMIDIKVTNASGKFVGWKKDHLALSYAYGDGQDKSCLLTVDAVSRLFNDIPIIYYMGMNLSSLSDVMNLVGEIDVVSPNNDLVAFDSMYKQGNRITITANNVEQFVRYRNTEISQSNERRMERQKEFMSGYLAGLKQKISSGYSSMLAKTVSMLGNMATNISVSEAGNILDMAYNYSFDADKDYYRLEGTAQEGLLHDEFYLDEEKLQELILETFYKMTS